MKLLDQECGKNDSYIEEAIIELLELCWKHTELTTYLILYGIQLQHISDVRRRYIVASADNMMYKSAFNHREIIFNACITERWLNEEFTYMDPMEDYNQMWHVCQNIKDISKYSYDENNYPGFYDMKTEEMKRVYDCWACLMLDTNDIDFRHHILDHVDDILEHVFKTSSQAFMIFPSKIATCFKAPTNNEKLGSIISDIIETAAEKIEIQYNELSELHKHIFDQGVRYMLGYVWLDIVKRALTSLSHTFDSDDYLLFSHTMYQITRFNYNNDSEVK